jgi:tRNA dimethylallyltransferase
VNTRATNNGNELPPIIAITGPTAVGKSAVALELGARFGAEIISADSRQIFRHLDIGTAKPTVAEQAALPHHLIDVVDPDQYYSAAAFREDTERILVDLKRRGRVALLVGGSYHYLQAVLERLDIPRVPPQPELRAELESFARESGAQALHNRLREVDPEGADQIAATNIRRVVRALEVCTVTGEPFSRVGRRRGEPVPALRLGITTDRETLYSRIDQRLDQQIADGLLEETRRVLEMGYDASLPPLAGLVYREAVAILQGRMGPAEAAQKMKENTHAFVRRQYVWFRKDPHIEWFEYGPELMEQVRRRVQGYIDRQ